MSKITLNNVGSLIDATTAVSTINLNFDTIETAFDNTLSRNGSSPNRMQSSLDMNSNRILNLPVAISAGEPVTFETFNSALIGSGNVPTGGSTNQILAKRSSTDFDTAWVDLGNLGNAVASSITISPTAGTLTQALKITQSPVGTITGLTPFVFSTANALNYINVTSDAVNMGDSNEYTAFGIVHKSGGPTVLGQRSAIHAEQWLTAATGTETELDILGGTFQAFAQVADNHNFIGCNSIAALFTGSGHALGLTGHEIDIFAQTGSSMNNKFGISIIQISDDTAQGSAEDAGIVFYNNGTSGGWKKGLDFKASTVSASGIGIDMSSLTLGSLAYLFKGPQSRFYVDGSGNIGTNNLNVLKGAVNPILVAGTTSGQGQFAVPAVLGTPTWTLPTGTGTFVVTASAPLAIDAVTGNLTVGAVASSSITVGTTIVSGGTTNGVLYDDSGAKVASTIAGTNGQLFLGTTGSPPAWATMSGGASITNAGVVTILTNANLTGPITSTGNATSIASQTGTGTKFVVDASPTLTGTPLTTTAAVDTNTTQIASTAFVIAQAASATPLIDGSATVGTSTRFARGDHIHPTDTTRAPLASPTFTGTVTHPTPFTLGAISVTTTGTQLNYLNAATGTTGTTSTNVVFSTSPTLVTPILGTPTSGTLTNCTGLSLTAGVTGILPVANGGTGNAGGAWTTSSPTVTPETGAFTSVAAAAHYLIEGKKLTYTIQITITTAGTAAGSMSITLPGTAPAATAGAFSGVEAATGFAVSASVGGGSSTLVIRKYDATTIIASGRFVTVSGVIEIQ